MILNSKIQCEREKKTCHFFFTLFRAAYIHTFHQCIRLIYYTPEHAGRKKKTFEINKAERGGENPPYSDFYNNNSGQQHFLHVESNICITP